MQVFETEASTDKTRFETEMNAVRARHWALWPLCGPPRARGSGRWGETPDLIPGSVHQAGIPLPEKKAPKTPREPVEGTASKKRKASGEKEKKGRSAYIMCAARPPARRLPASSISPSYRHTASARGRQSGRAPRVGSLPLLACPLLRERPPGWCAGFAPRRA